MFLPWLGACSDEPAGEASDSDQAADSASATDAGEPPGVIARVGDQTITFHEINTMMNSAAIVGLSMPELGSPERLTVRITLLDKLISGNLLYLDALQKGIDQDPEYQQDVGRFRDAILSNLYRTRVLVGDVEVTEQDIQDFYKQNIVEGTEFTEELRAGIEATIRKKRMKQRTANMRERLRKGHETAINVTELDPAEDQVRSDSDVVAELDGAPITWGEVRAALERTHALRSTQARIEAL